MKKETCEITYVVSKQYIKRATLAIIVSQFKKSILFKISVLVSLLIFLSAFFAEIFIIFLDKNRLSDLNQIIAPPIILLMILIIFYYYSIRSGIIGTSGGVSSKVNVTITETSIKGKTDGMESSFSLESVTEDYFYKDVVILYLNKQRSLVFVFPANKKTFLDLKKRIRARRSSK